MEERQMANQKHDMVVYPIQDDVRLEVYWRDDARRSRSCSITLCL